jgi:hypothetical protein
LKPKTEKKCTIPDAAASSPDAIRDSSQMTSLTIPTRMRMTMTITAAMR